MNKISSNTFFITYVHRMPPVLLTNINRVIKSKRMRWTGHVAHMGEGRGEMHTGF